MFHTLLKDNFIDPYQVDSDFNKPRKNTVIFSAFHKILY
jgi:hypothetical protein